MFQIEQTGHHDIESLASELDEGVALKFPKQKSLINYRELLAKERAEAVPHSLGN